MMHRAGGFGDVEDDDLDDVIVVHLVLGRAGVLVIIIVEMQEYRYELEN